MERRRFLGAAAGLGLVVGASPWAGALAQSDEPHAFYGHRFKDLSGEELGFDSYLGRTTVLNFWATWCPPCVREMPDLDKLSQEYKDVNFIGLAVDTAANVEKFLKKVPVSYPLLVAGHGGIKLMRQLGNTKGGLPFTVVFSADGRNIKEFLGQVEPEALAAVLDNVAQSSASGGSAGS